MFSGIRCFRLHGSGEDYCALKMEAVGLSETLVPVYHTTRRHNPERRHPSIRSQPLLH